MRRRPDDARAGGRGRAGRCGRHHALLEVLDAGPAVERGRRGRTRRWPRAVEPAAYLVGELALERQAAPPGSRRSKSRSRRPSSRDQLGDRVGVVVDAQVDERRRCRRRSRRPASDDEQRRALPAAASRRRRGRRRAARRAAGGANGRAASAWRQACSTASTTSGPVRMLPWIAYADPARVRRSRRPPRRSTPRRCSVAAPPRASTIAGLAVLVRRRPRTAAW